MREAAARASWRATGGGRILAIAGSKHAERALRRGRARDPMHEPKRSFCAKPAPSSVRRHAARGALATAILAMLFGCGETHDASRNSDATAGGASAGGDELVDPARVGGTEITEEVAYQLFPGLSRTGDRKIYDPVAYIVLRPDDDRTFDFPEYPGGKIRFRTNNMGFREDEPTTVEHDTYRILVSGDSHTEGVCANSESLANVLERLLNDEHAA